MAFPTAPANNAAHIESGQAFLAQGRKWLRKDSKAHIISRNIGNTTLRKTTVTLNKQPADWIDLSITFSAKSTHVTELVIEDGSGFAMGVAQFDDGFFNTDKGGTGTETVNPQMRWGVDLLNGIAMVANQSGWKTLYAHYHYFNMKISPIGATRTLVKFELTAVDERGNSMLSEGGVNLNFPFPQIKTIGIDTGGGLYGGSLICKYW